MIFPNNKKFALTIIDDTDNATLENVRPIYELLMKLGFKTTKTIWTLPPKDNFRGVSMENYNYRQFINNLERHGFEIALHSVGSGNFNRQDIIDGLEIYKKYLGQYPKIQINHAFNPDNLYWGVKRFLLLKPFWFWSKFKGDDQKSPFFWGDYHKKYFKYLRNFTFNRLNTIRADCFMPYKDPNKLFGNYFFSATEAPDIKKFNQAISEENIKRLEAENGVAIIFTHFASGFIKKGRLDAEFKKNLFFLSKQDGWFVPASEILDYLAKQKNRGRQIKNKDLIRLEIKWFLDHLRARFKG